MVWYGVAVLKQHIYINNGAYVYTFIPEHAAREMRAANEDGATRARCLASTQRFCAQRSLRLSKITFNGDFCAMSM